MWQQLWGSGVRVCFVMVTITTDTISNLFVEKCGLIVIESNIMAINEVLCNLLGGF